LDHLVELVLALRALKGLKEQRPGIFYRRSRAFLHFHEDVAGIFADVRAANSSDFDRFDVTDPAHWPDFMAEVAKRL